MTCGLAANVRDYGAVGDSTTDDSAAFQAAIDAALAGPKAVFVPPGNYLVPATLNVTGSLAFRGGGRGFTTLIHPTASNGFTITAPNGATVEFEDFTLQGPAGLGFDNNALGISFVVGGGFDTRFSVRRVAVLGTFDHAIMRSGGGIFELDDCHLEGTDAAVAAFESSNAVDGMFVTMRGCTLTTPNGDLSSQGSVGFYVHPHVPYLVTGCRFITIGRYGVYENGSPSSSRRPSIISGCQFVNAGVLKSETRGQTNVVGCSAKGTLSGLGSTLYGHETSFTGCSFENCGPQTVIRSGRFTGCTFVNSGVTLTSGGTLTGTSLLVDGCKFKLDAISPIFNGSFISVVGVALRAKISDCVFEDVTTTGTTNTALYLAGTAHDAVVSDCSFYGIRTTHGLGVIFHRGVRLRLEDNEFDNTVQGNVAGVNCRTLGALEGSGNVFRGTAKIGQFDGMAQQRFTRRPGVNPTPVPSAASVDTNTAAWLSYDTHVITGTAAIATLANPWVAVGPVRLVVAAGATWSTADTGNIAPRVLSARTPGAVVTLLWEPTAAKWLEV